TPGSVRRTPPRLDSPPNSATILKRHSTVPSHALSDGHRAQCAANNARLLGCDRSGAILIVAAPAASLLTVRMLRCVVVRFQAARPSSLPTGDLVVSTTGTFQ